MSARTVVIITDQLELARALARYVRHVLGREWEPFYLTYDSKENKLSPTLTRQADLFIVELMRSYGSGLRAEGIPVAEALLRSGKRVLVVSSGVCSELSNEPVYWDLGADKSLAQRIAGLMEEDVPPPDSLAALRSIFAAYSAAPAGHHHGAHAPDARR